MLFPFNVMCSIPEIIILNKGCNTSESICVNSLNNAISQMIRHEIGIKIIICLIQGEKLTLGPAWVWVYLPEQTLILNNISLKSKRYIAADMFAELHVKPGGCRLLVSSSRLKAFGAILNIGLKLGERQIAFDGFHSKAAQDEKLREAMTDEEKKLWKGMAYAWLCWLLERVRAYNPSYNDETPVTLFAYGYVDPEQEKFTGLVLYYATMGFGVWGVREVEKDDDFADEEFYVPSEMFVAMLKAKEKGKKISWETFNELYPEAPQDVYENLKDSLDQGGPMHTTLGKILQLCLQSKSNNEKRKIFCRSNKVPLTKIVTPEKEYTGDLSSVLPEVLKTFLTC